MIIGILTVSDRASRSEYEALGGPIDAVHRPGAGLDRALRRRS